MNTTYHHPTLEQSMSDFAKEISQDCKIPARAAGSRNLPVPVGGTFKHLFEELHHKVQDKINHVYGELQPQATIFQANQASQSAGKEFASLVNKAVPLHIRNNELEKKLKDLKPSPKTSGRHRLLIWLALAILGAVEGFFSMQVFESLGYNVLESIIIGLALGAVLAILAHNVPWIINRLGKTLRQKRLLSAGFAIALFAFFYGLGAYRAQYLETLAARHGLQQSYSPWPFAIASSLIFIIGVTLTIRYSPSHEEMLIKHEFDSLGAEKKAVEQQLGDIERHQSAIDKEKDISHAGSASALELGRSLEEKLVNCAYQCWSIFKHENLMHRTDLLEPDCISEAYPLEFDLYFQFVPQAVIEYKR